MGVQADNLPIGGQFRQWAIVKKLGEGAFGNVYKVLNAKTREMCAMKTEPATEDDSMIRMEVAILKTFRNSPLPHPHVCDYVDSGTTPAFRYVVMKLAGPNLADVRKSCPKARFTEGTTARLGIQCVESVESLHRIGFVHRDIKPPNYAIGTRGDERTVYLLDFGLSRQYVNRDGVLRPPRDHVGFRGTVRYASVNAHRRRDLARHNDLISLFYMMVELQKGQLPWKNITGRRSEEHAGGPIAGRYGAEIFPNPERVAGIRFQGHAELRVALRSERRNVKEEDPYDWEKGGSAHEQFKQSGIAKQPFKKQKKAQKKVEREHVKDEDKSIVEVEEGK